ncbi:hypothetical protein [Thermomonospora umbrina]|uniref:hypothetical protein n=1 Tax=Thermomonospora umbrina TaxID=111806 RepID=UPI0011C1BE2F|nr:hypothetical protein [Thermomonospora umbrina]
MAPPSADVVSTQVGVGLGGDLGERAAHGHQQAGAGVGGQDAGNPCGARGQHGGGTESHCVGGVQVPVRALTDERHERPSANRGGGAAA